MQNKGMGIGVLYVVHLANRPVVIVLVETAYGRHVVVVFRLGPGLVGGFFARILLHIFYKVLGGGETDYGTAWGLINAPLTLMS